MLTSISSIARQSLFVCVGTCCFLVQFGILTALASAGVNRPVANAAGFIVSAQLNFLLSSRLTWRDRPASTTRTAWARLASYNATALLSLAVNTAVFTITYRHFGDLPASGFGVVCGMCVTYLVCDLLIFRNRRKPASEGQSARRVRARYTPAHRRPVSHGPRYRVGHSRAARTPSPAVRPVADRRTPAIPPVEGSRDVGRGPSLSWRLESAGANVTAITP